MNKLFLTICIVAAALTQSGCAYFASGLFGGASVNNHLARPYESDARIRCGNNDCDAVPVQSGTLRQRSPYAFWGITLLEAAGGMYLMQVGGNDLDEFGSHDTPLGTRLLGGSILIGAAIDFFLAAIFKEEFQPVKGTKDGAGCCFLPERTIATWQGHRMLLHGDDLVNPAQPGQFQPYFSLTQAAERRDAQPEKYAKDLLSNGDKPGILGKGKRLAVLGFKSGAKDIPLANVRYFSNQVRQAALAVTPKIDIMTEENMQVLLAATGKDLASCEGECEVDTGRRIGADAVVSGDVLKLGSVYKLSMRLHDTQSGRLLAAAAASGSTIDELDAAVNQTAMQLLREQ